MKLHLNQGINNLRFGMTRTKVESILGQPDKILIDPDDENELIWEYSDQKLRLTFYQNEADRLGYIRCSNSNLTIKGLQIIDKKIVDVQNQIDSDPDAWEIEEYHFFKVYFLEQYWLSLQVEYERVTVIEHGVPFKNDDEYDWPDEDDFSLVS
ncbi:hypothetical protein [Phaeocystidibacter luteus]|uniref:Uncharacterized protein n=1 Tax=Phaeocystidibacter luteus TaxID=911197 RepID=A0A6N6RF52_9FLAO|nr:hypothetical protein [Phaeocystidibacter luteus]KAB2807699.1 hypothetical protein F8C67_11705 [Phaeocystidibacter luteus]